MPEVNKGTILEFFSSTFGNWTASGIHYAEDEGGQYITLQLVPRTNKRVFNMNQY